MMLEITYIDNIPDDPPPSGNPITINIQGVTHDDDNGYFTSIRRKRKRGKVYYERFH
jgi:hypothetical protein